MTTMVNIHEAKTHLSRFIERARAGEEIIIAKSGTPWVKLVPIDQHEKRRRPGLAEGSLTDAFFEPLSDDELKAWGN